MQKSNIILKKIIGIPLIIICYFLFELISNDFIVLFTSRNIRNEVAEYNIKTIEKALLTYHAEHKQFPSTDEGLKVLNGYIPGGEIPFDPWGNQYYYEKQDIYFIIHSKGPDGILFTTDDIWNKDDQIKENRILDKKKDEIWKIYFLVPLLLLDIIFFSIAICFVFNIKITIKKILLLCTLPFAIFIWILASTLTTYPY